MIDKLWLIDTVWGSVPTWKVGGPSGPASSILALTAYEKSITWVRRQTHSSRNASKRPWLS